MKAFGPKDPKEGGLGVLGASPEPVAPPVRTEQARGGPATEART